MKLSARNQLKGVIKEIENGAVNAVVKLDIGGGNIISATISMDAVKALNLSVGKEAYAVIKSTSVLFNIVCCVSVNILSAKVPSCKSIYLKTVK